MPIQRCYVDGKSGYKWGNRGKCYTGSAGRSKALRQARAIRASGWTENAKKPSPGSTVLRTDPTRTKMLRDKFVRELRGRYDSVKRLIIQVVEKENAFDLVTNQRFAFSTTAQQTEAFSKWIKEQLHNAVTPSTDDYWYWYAAEAFKRGAGRAFDDVHTQQRATLYGGTEKMAHYAGTREEFLRSAFAHPISIDKLKLLAGRTLTDLKNVNEATAAQMNRVLTDGLARGESPRTIARELNNAIDGIGKNRSSMIARTEIIRAHAEGQLDALEKLGIAEVGLEVEWSTTGDSLVCPKCAANEGTTYKIEEAHGQIPYHPNCRCAWIPAGGPVMGEKPKREAKPTPEEKAEEAPPKAPAPEIPPPPPKPVVPKLPTPEEAAALGQQLKSMDIHHPAVANLDVGGMGWEGVQSYGAVLFDDYGRILLREPTGHFGGYAWTFPKGTEEAGMGALKTAIKEVGEESGHKMQVLSALPGKYEGTTGDTAMFVGRSKAFDAKLMDNETYQVRWATKEEAIELIKQSKNKKGRERDLKILEDAFKELDLLKQGKRNETFTNALASGKKAHAAKVSEGMKKKWAAKKAAKEGLEKAAGQATPVIPKAPQVEIPNPRKLTFEKNLPGSTKPTLMRDSTGKRWVVKSVEAGVQPDHLKSEALADNLYRILGIDSPASGTVETGEGLAKVSEFLEEGKTLGEWLKTASAAEQTKMFKQIQEGFVTDSLLGNWDVAGLDMDNILVVKGRAFRIDNGGALFYRAQGARKRNFGGVVNELESLRDESVNANTAKMFKGISQQDIDRQILAIASKKDELLKAIDDPELRNVMKARIEYLEGKVKALPPAPTSTWKERAMQRRAETKISADTADRVVASRINGVTLRGDRDLIEDNNILMWQEMDADNNPVTKVTMKLTTKGSTAVQNTLSKLGVDIGDMVTVQDSYWQVIESGAKTVATHAADGKYNTGTLASLNNTLDIIKERIKSATADEKKMLLYYQDSIEKILKAKQDKKVPPMLSKYTPPKPKAGGSRISKQTEGHSFRLTDLKDGRAKSSGLTQEFQGKRIAIQLDDNTEVLFTPRRPTRPSYKSGEGLAFEGNLDITIKGKVTQERLQEALAKLNSLGVDADPSDSYEELMYLHRSIYMRGDFNNPTYRSIFESPIPDEEKIAKIQAWAEGQYDVNFEKLKKAGQYNPQGYTNSFGDGYRHWDRWDLTPKQVEKKLKDYALIHNTTHSTIETLKGMLQSGGEATSTTERLRKGVSVSRTGGMSSSTDIDTGGAGYFFTRIKKAEDTRAPLVFKIRALARQDTITYNDDMYGDVTKIDQRKSTIEQYKSAARNTSNETLLKHNAFLLDDIEFINVQDQAEKGSVIRLFKDNGIEVLPDGRKIDDIVIVYGETPARTY